MLTLAFAQLVWSLVFQWGAVTGGDDGLVNIWPAEWLKPTVVYFYFALIFSVCGILLMRHVQHSPFGYALRAARDSQRQAEATGINTRQIQAYCFWFCRLHGGHRRGAFRLFKGQRISK